LVLCGVLGAGAGLRTSCTVLVPMPRGPRASQPAGSPANFSRQPGLQKKYVVPSWTKDPFAFAGSTVIPQTGSTARPSVLTPLLTIRHAQS
jgi:hypothetical protein